MIGIVAMGDKLNNMPTDYDRVKFCLFIIGNGFKHRTKRNAILAGSFCHGYLSSLLIGHKLNEF